MGFSKVVTGAVKCVSSAVKRIAGKGPKRLCNRCHQFFVGNVCPYCAQDKEVNGGR